MSEFTNTNGRKSVLILEDNEELVELLIDLMDNRKDEIISTDRAEHAIQKLKQKKFDLLICDLQLPGMSGVEFLKICHAENNLPKNVMIISGDIQHPELKQEFMRNFIILEKPFFIEKFPNLVSQLLSN